MPWAISGYLVFIHHMSKKGLEFLFFLGHSTFFSQSFARYNKTLKKNRKCIPKAYTFCFLWMRLRRVELPREIFPLAPQASASTIPPQPRLANLYYYRQQVVFCQYVCQTSLWSVNTCSFSTPSQRPHLYFFVFILRLRL